ELLRKELYYSNPKIRYKQNFDNVMFKLHGVLKYKLFDKIEKPDEHQFVLNAKKRLRDLSEKRNEILKRTKRDGTENIDSVKSIFPEASGYILEAYSKKDDAKKKELFLEGLKKFPESYELMISYARFLTDKDNMNPDFEEAFSFFNKADLIKKNDHYLYNYWGVALSNFAKTKDNKEAEDIYENAIRKYDQAIKIKPDDSCAYYNKILVLYVLAENKTKPGKLFSRAKEYFKQTLDLKPNREKLLQIVKAEAKPNETTKWIRSNAVNIILKIDNPEYEGNVNFNKNVIWNDLDDTKLIDISILKEIKFLTKLSLYSNQITNLEPLKELKNSIELDLSGNQITDIEPLKELKNLTALWLQDNKIVDLKPLKELRNLIELYLSENQITNLESLKELKELRVLYLTRNPLQESQIIELKKYLPVTAIYF
ncbi:MAG: leucine-rich repeat domain-containing protein, partial [Candidatus Cloacimonetes bacterium]|nr:leucine-rich repeat domain-containing protein [Candidatus Cloacimonadota bacterium]